MATNIQFDGGVVAAFAVRNTSETIEWFKDKLGWEVIFRSDEVGWAEIATSVKNVAIGMSQAEKFEVAGGPTLTFGVKDIESTKKELEAKGVKFDGDIVEYPGMVKLATWYDCNGHKFMFYQSLSQPSQ